MKLINIGFGNLLSLDRIISILSPDSSPIKRIIQDAKEKGNIIDASQGRKTKSVIITDSNHVVLSSLNPEILMNRISDNLSEGEKLEDEL